MFCDTSTRWSWSALISSCAGGIGHGYHAVLRCSLRPPLGKHQVWKFPSAPALQAAGMLMENFSYACFQEFSEEWLSSTNQILLIFHRLFLFRVRSLHMHSTELHKKCVPAFPVASITLLQSLVKVKLPAASVPHQSQSGMRCSLKFPGLGSVVRSTEPASTLL